MHLNKTPRLHFPSLLTFCISLSSNTENPGSKHHSCFTHFHFHVLSRIEKYGVQKTAHKVVCLQQISFASVLGICVSICLETHSWISLDSRSSFYQNISTRHARVYVTGYMFHVLFVCLFVLSDYCMPWNKNFPAKSKVVCISKRNWAICLHLSAYLNTQAGCNKVKMDLFTPGRVGPSFLILHSLLLLDVLSCQWDKTEIDLMALWCCLVLTWNQWDPRQL